MFLFGINKAVALIKDRDEENFSKLLSRNSKLVRERDGSGNTCLHYAVIEKHYEIALLLLLRGADIDAVEQGGYSPLHLALENQCEQIAVMLCQRGANVNLKLLKSGATPLHLAAAYDLRESMTFLLGRGADINALDNNSHTPLLLAMRCDHVELAALLIVKGAELTHKDNNGKSCSDYAREMGVIGLLAMIEQREEKQKREWADRRDKADKLAEEMSIASTTKQSALERPADNTFRSHMSSSTSKSSPSTAAPTTTAAAAAASASLDELARGWDQGEAKQVVKNAARGGMRKRGAREGDQTRRRQSNTDTDTQSEVTKSDMSSVRGGSSISSVSRARGRGRGRVGERGTTRSASIDQQSDTSIDKKRIFKSKISTGTEGESESVSSGSKALDNATFQSTVKPAVGDEQQSSVSSGLFFR